MHKFPAGTLEYVLMPEVVVGPKIANKVEVNLDHLGLPVSFSFASNTFLERPRLTYRKIYIARENLFYV